MRISSQKSRKAALAAREPKRQRGKLRVAALLEAGAAVFMERGYDASTMTEIAARAKTAIGSLYQFFPSKEALADALLMRYAEKILSALEGIEQRAAGLSPAELASALVDLKLGLQSDRAAALALADARALVIGGRKELREAMLRRMSGVLRAVQPQISESKAEGMAVIVMHILKLVPELTQREKGERLRLLEEVREVIRLYLENAGL